MSIGTYWTDFISLIFPELCLACQKPLPKGNKYICPSCHYNLPKANTYQDERNLFKDKFEGIVPIKDVLVYTYFIKDGIMQKVLHELKYNDNPDIGEVFGRWYGHELLLNGFSDSFDCIVPVPLHPKKIKSRGYNQVAAFGRGLSEVLNADLLDHALVKTENIDSQTKKDKVSRILSVCQLFKFSGSDDIHGKKVLLVDDVLTTGSTLIACAQVLSEQSLESLSIAVLSGVK